MPSQDRKPQPSQILWRCWPHLCRSESGPFTEASLLSGPTQSWDKPCPSGTRPRPSWISHPGQATPLSIWPFHSLCGPLSSGYSIPPRRRCFPYSMPALLFPEETPTDSPAAVFRVRVLPILQSQALPGLSPDPGPGGGRNEGEPLRCEAPLQDPADDLP